MTRTRRGAALGPSLHAPVRPPESHGERRGGDGACPRVAGGAESISGPVSIRVGQTWESRDRRDDGRRATVSAYNPRTDYVGLKSTSGRCTRCAGTTLRSRYRLIHEESPVVTVETAGGVL